MSACRSCSAPIKWAKSEASGKMMPLNPSPIMGGNVVIVDKEGTTPIVRIVKGDPEVAAYISHFADCPNGPAHRKKS